MPTYDYQCKKCGSTQEEFHSIKEDPVIKCIKCGKSTVRQVSSTFGVVFKGAGFYQTDYKNKEQLYQDSSKIKKEILSGNAETIEDFAGPEKKKSGPKHQSKKCKVVHRRDAK